MPDERGRGRDAGRVATTRKVTMSGTTKATPAVAPSADPAPPILPTAPTTPVGRLPHGSTPPRGLERAVQSALALGRFGRMFRNLPVYEHRRETLIELGGLMIQPLPAAPEKMDEPLGVADDDENVAKLGAHLRLPAGYTYFGQFVDHDITFDPVSSLTRQNDPDALTDFRTPRFDLDSLYGRGPSDQPYLYEGNGLKLALGDARPAAGGPFSGPDLQRGAGGRALIGDPRNDENRMVSQLHVAFIKFHNAVVETHRSASPAMAEPD